MTATETAAVGAINPRLKLGDLVVGRNEFAGDNFTAVSSLIMSMLDGDMPDVIYSRLGRDQLIIPANNFYLEDQHKIRNLLAELGVSYAICGTTPKSNIRPPDKEFKKYQTQVADWETAHPTLDTEYLEQIFTGGDPETVSWFVTSLTFSRVFERIFEESGEQDSAGWSRRLYQRTAQIASAHRGFRAHLLTGTVQFGTPTSVVGKRRRQQTEWGITPAALYGMTLETSQRSTYGFGEKGAIMAGRLLDVVASG